MAKRFGKVKSYTEWIEPTLASNAIELLDKELPKFKGKIKSVQLCFTTDPFMDKYPEVGEMSLKMVKRINMENIKCVILTKGTLPECLLETERCNEYGMTLVSLHDDFKRVFEPFPTPNIDNTPIEEILNEIWFVDKIVFGRLHYDKHVGKYRCYQEFYNRTAEAVIAFCKAKNKHCHIKNGTLVINGEKREVDF